MIGSLEEEKTIELLKNLCCEFDKDSMMIDSVEELKLTIKLLKDKFDKESMIDSLEEEELLKDFFCYEFDKESMMKDSLEVKDKFDKESMMIGSLEEENTIELLKNLCCEFDKDSMMIAWKN